MEIATHAIIQERSSFPLWFYFRTMFNLGSNQNSHVNSSARKELLAKDRTSKIGSRLKKKKNTMIIT